jgi:hypothetical protein
LWVDTMQNLTLQDYYSIRKKTSLMRVSTIIFHF